MIMGNNTNQSIKIIKEAPKSSIKLSNSINSGIESSKTNKAEWQVIYIFIKKINEKNK